MNTLSTVYFRVFSNFFNRSYIIDYINKKNPKIINQLQETNNQQFLSQISELTYTDFFDFLYKELKSYYKCEYVYLNEILLNEILSKHQVNHKVITELKINNSAADLVIINGTTTVYEIKTELDTLARLESQLENYIQSIDKVYVVTHKDMANKLYDYLSDMFPTVGIYILNRNNRLKAIKKATSNRNHFNKEVMFKMLNRNEFQFISEDYYEALKKFNTFSFDECHKILKNSLFNRALELDFLSSIPDSLKLATFKIYNNLNYKQKGKFLVKLNKKMKEDL